MANTTLTSAPSEIDKNKLKEAVSDALEPHLESGDEEAAKESMRHMAARIQQGDFGPPASTPPKFDLSFIVGQTQLGGKPDWHVNFTWHW